MPSRTDSHQSYILEDGTYVPGSTTVIDGLGWNKRVLMGWVRKQCLAGKDPYKIRDKAASIGTVAHALVEEHIRKTLDSDAFAVIDPEEYAPQVVRTASRAYNAYLDWEQQNNVVYHSAELQLVSEEYRYGGTIDIVAEVNGKMYVLDIKTSSGVYSEHIIQLASYWNLYLENFGEDYDAMIIHLDKKDGSFSPHYIPRTKILKGFEVFKSLRNIYDYRNKF